MRDLIISPIDVIAGRHPPFCHSCALTRPPGPFYFRPPPRSSRILLFCQCRSDLLSHTKHLLTRHIQTGLSRLPSSGSISIASKLDSVVIVPRSPPVNMSYYEPQGWQAPAARQASWEQPAPPSRSGMDGNTPIPKACIAVLNTYDNSSSQDRVPFPSVTKSRRFLLSLMVRIAVPCLISPCLVPRPSSSAQAYTLLAVPEFVACSVL